MCEGVGHSVHLCAHFCVQLLTEAGGQPHQLLSALTFDKQGPMDPGGSTWLGRLAQIALEVVSCRFSRAGIPAVGSGNRNEVLLLL